MHVDKKVGWALELIGFVLLLATAIFNLKIFWAVFGFSCAIAGAYKVIKRLLVERNSNANKNEGVWVSSDDINEHKASFGKTPGGMGSKK